MDYTNPQTLLAAVEQMPPVTTFLSERYFPTNPVTDIFSTNEVLVEYKEGDKKLAPFVSPRKNGVTMLRNGYETKSYAPANIAPKRPITIDDLKKKGFGEALFSNMTPEQRQLTFILSDIQDLQKMIARRREYMAAQTMLNNGCIMKHYADKGDEYEEKEIKFYNESSNPAIYTPTIDWDSSNADILSDLYLMARKLKSKGNAATDVIMGSSTLDKFLNNDIIQKLLDNKNINIGNIAPMELPEGATRIAVINVKGTLLNILSYDETFDADDGADTPYIPAKKIIMTAPGAGRTAYGAVTQVEQSDGQMHTYPGIVVPHYVADANNNTRNVTVTSCPLLMPNKKNPWGSASVME